MFECFDIRNGSDKVIMAKNSVVEFNKFLISLDVGVEPTIHVNGQDHLGAVVVVDFGTPLKPVRLASDLSQEMASRLRKLTREIVGNRDCNVRISSDYANGVFWSSIG